MFIVIHCMGLPFNGDTINTESLGGSETAAYYMAKELAAKGHRVTMFTTSEQEGEWDGVKYIYMGAITDKAPLGEIFHFYGENTPHDVMIIQRSPYAFRFVWASKINLWWVHDLAQYSRAQDVQSQLWNITGVLTVSEFQKKQYVEVYGINPDVIFPIQNGVDLSLFEGEIIIDYLQKKISSQVSLLYSSRPERGLEHLVMPDGIMERLAKVDSKYHLYVCAYENTTAEAAGYYGYLKQRCEALPNVTILGALTKQELADVMRQCDVMVYPTPGPQQKNFEEVSCITAMECMAAGLPFISCDIGALSETCNGSGSVLLDLDEKALPIIEYFVDEIVEQTLLTDNKSILRFNQLDAAKDYTWTKSAGMLMHHIENCFTNNISDGAKARHLLESSDIYALQQLQLLNTIDRTNAIEVGVLNEGNDCYKFAFMNTWEEHYKKYYDYEKERGIDYGPETLDNNMRFEFVSSLVADIPSGGIVLDYGCAHGHYTVNLAKRFPDKEFIGIDITESNVEKANLWCEKEGIKNARFIYNSIRQDKVPEGECVFTDYKSSNKLPLVDCIIAAEVLEHVGDSAKYVNVLSKLLKNDKSKMIITTPFGPWEAMGYAEHYPWRAHVHHFDREDLHELWGHFPNFKVNVAPSGRSTWGSILGSYITTFSKPKIDSESRTIDYSRKIDNILPRQTVSLCMIVKDAEDTIKRCLDSVADVVDEVNLAIDEATSDNTMQTIELWTKSRAGNWPVVTVKTIKSPLEIGFDEARNESIKDASGDWILWMDSDEIMVNANSIFKYLHNNGFNGYALKQHHFTVEPLGVLKTDLPCRLFRNHKGVRFFGVVHEHPERSLNEGVGHVQLIPDIEIAHQGYTTEAIRRGRFQRNLDLIARDREKYPERVLGKFLWLRDLSQMCKYELEVNGGSVTLDMKERAKAGIKLWEELLEDKHLRMLTDGMEFYSLLATIQGGGFEMGFAISTSKMNGGVHMGQVQPVQANFANEKHAKDFLNALFNEKVKSYESKYF